jgi:polysaccharide export outer membrane protein
MGLVSIERKMKMIKRTSWVALIGILCLVTSCVSDIPSVKTLSEYYQGETKESQSTESYRIGSGDVLAVDVWGEERLSKQVTVRLDGKMSLPLVEDIQAAGLTCEELENLLEQKYKDFVDAPEVSATLLQSGSGKVYLVGKVRSPGEYPLEKKMTLLQAISRAGGLDQWADASDVRLVRTIDGVERQFKVDYEAVVSGKDLSQNIILEPGDTIVVP